MEGWSPLAAAAHEGHDAVAEALLNCGAKPDASTDAPQDASPLLLAVQKGHASMVRLLLARAARTEVADRSGFSPLARAAQQGNDEVSSNSRSTSKPPFLKACEPSLNAKQTIKFKGNLSCLNVFFFL